MRPHSRPIDENSKTVNINCQPLPRGPVLGWSTFERIETQNIDSIEHLAHAIFTTSGRAAIYQALLQLQLPTSSTVLIPTYHCPTMVAPVLLANLNVAYFGLHADGLPNLATIDAATASKAGAMLVSHYFGFPKSLAEVRQWCDERGIALIEDCAHCYFGNAGGRPVGAWGDYATASLSKFFPVPEGGLLVAAHPITNKLQLTPQSLKAQIKGWIDVFELAAKFKRLAGLNSALGWLFWLKNARGIAQATEVQATSTSPPPVTVADMMHSCDMARIAQAPLNATNVLKRLLPRGRIILRRQQNFAAYAKHFSQVKGAKPLFPLPAKTAAPYVFPLWVDDAERVYREIRALGLPVFRWDRIWPGTPKLNDDVGPLWSQHVLQLLCHQDLGEADIERTALEIINLLTP